MNYASIKSLLSAGLLTIGAAAIVACGSESVPSGSVAKVGDEEITQEEFDKWLKTAVSGQAQGTTTAVPDPPDFTKCVAAKKDAPLPKGQKQQSEAALKKQCEQEYDTLKREVMLFLIQAEWVEQEAEEQGVEVSDASVKKSFEDQKKQAFPTDKAYTRVHQELGHVRGGHPLPRQAQRAAAEAHAEGDPGRHEGHRRGHPGVLRQEQAALRTAGAA